MFILNFIYYILLIIIVSKFPGSIPGTPPLMMKHWSKIGTERQKDRRTENWENWQKISWNLLTLSICRTLARFGGIQYALSTSGKFTVKWRWVSTKSRLIVSPTDSQCTHRGPNLVKESSEAERKDQLQGPETSSARSYHRSTITGISQGEIRDITEPIARGSWGGGHSAWHRRSVKLAISWEEQHNW